MATRDYLLRFRRDVQVKTACEDAGCEARRYGWETQVDEATPLGREQAAYIRHQSGRDFTERRTGTGITVFRFMPGQRCFAEHRTRPARFLVADGARSREHVSLGDWIEDAGEHVTRIEQLRQRG